MNKKWVILFSLIAISSCNVKKIQGNGELNTFKEVNIRNIKQLTFEGDNGEAYFSWDDSRLIFQSSMGGYECDKIWIMNIDGAGKRMVSPDHGAHTCSYFFPGDKEIIFASTNYMEAKCPPRRERPKGVHYMWPLYPYNIFKADADGKSLTRITHNVKYDAEPVISSDGKKIVFGSQRDGDFDIYTMNSDGSGLKRLTHEIGYDGGPWFSPDGKKIVWRAWHPSNGEEHKLWRDCMKNNYIVAVPLDIWIMDADGSSKKRLLKNGATNWAPSWHPDGKRIIFSSNKDDWRDDIKQYGHNFELYIMNLEGSGLIRLTYNKVFDSFPMFSHDGKKLVFASNRNADNPRATDIFIADWEEGPLR